MSRRPARGGCAETRLGVSTLVEYRYLVVSKDHRGASLPPTTRFDHTHHVDRQEAVRVHAHLGRGRAPSLLDGHAADPAQHHRPDPDTANAGRWLAQLEEPRRRPRRQAVFQPRPLLCASLHRALCGRHQDPPADRVVCARSQWYEEPGTTLMALCCPCVLFSTNHSRLTHLAAKGERASRPPPAPAAEGPNAN